MGVISVGVRGCFSVLIFGPLVPFCLFSWVKAYCVVGWVDIMVCEKEIWEYWEKWGSPYKPLNHLHTLKCMCSISHFEHHYFVWCWFLQPCKEWWNAYSVLVFFIVLLFINLWLYLMTRNIHLCLKLRKKSCQLLLSNHQLSYTLGEWFYCIKIHGDSPILSNVQVFVIII